MLNDYSRTWFEIFLRSIALRQTAVEAAFIEHFLPLPEFMSVLDLCCGEGRHAALLATAGHQVTGLDRDPEALARARHASPATTFLQVDMRDASRVQGPFDAVLCLWQSYGFFDEGTNTRLLAQIHRLLRPRGRFILDIYHRGFFGRSQGVRTFVKDGKTITETMTIENHRLDIQLDYGSGVGDHFNWQLYEPDEIISLAQDIGFSKIHASANFELASPPSPDRPRMQLIFETKTSA